jgi:hypothetical protein
MLLISVLQRTATAHFLMYITAAADTANYSTASCKAALCTCNKNACNAALACLPARLSCSTHSNIVCIHWMLIAANDITVSPHLLMACYSTQLQCASRKRVAPDAPR